MPITAGELYAHTHTQRRIQVGLLCVCMSVWELCKREKKETERKRESTTVHSRQAGPKAQSTSANKQYKQQHEHEVHMCVGAHIPMYVCMLYVCVQIYRLNKLLCTHAENIKCLFKRK